ncbi:S8 family peptidase [Pseudomonas agarici]|uniref:S8 family peptidase n=1 Tax=Pseudomonas agarici TaxID=46677 RepID=UPI0002F252BB|nr:S8 family peptidase [Pseudomonas agarici]NWB90271.1 S8 family peptidase [Pseudomonas agarici]NWC08810.1 S8 family peptidase [Pseudomonas agarici]SEK58437.1 Subtilase family protein [Pseudomonas agarici]
MTDQRRENLPHLFPQNTSSPEPFTSHRVPVRPPPLPVRDRALHGNALREQLQQIRPIAEQAKEEQAALGILDGVGLRVQFESFDDVKLAFESLANKPKGIELLNYKEEGERGFATVFVPDGKLDYFERVIVEYLDDRKGSTGRSLDHKALINTIQSIHVAQLEALWTDAPAFFPTDENEIIWWEAWLPVRDNRNLVVASFMQAAQLLGIRVLEGRLIFPERTVLTIQCSKAQLQQSVLTLNSIAELRRAKETADFFDSFTPAEQHEWAAELLGRTTFTSSEHTPHICILDTGVNHGHPLLTPALVEPDLHTIEPDWGVDDRHGHGTSMAGLALYGDLTHTLRSAEPLIIEHRLESVKLLPSDGANAGDEKNFGFNTVEAVARPEITAPLRARLFSMAVTTVDGRDRGRPSSWSSALDRLAFDADGQGASPRLFVISAGNIRESSEWVDYPSSNTLMGICDPAQAWNSLTVGAFTDLVELAPGLRAVAAQGGLSPFSTTSQNWISHYPLKPDVLFEGGNLIHDELLGPATAGELSLLTTHNRPVDRHLTLATATSAATSLCSRMAAQLMAAYPARWPETIRALIVHSAGWTDAMKQMFLPQNRNPTKQDYERLVRHCGFGVPSLDRAKWSASNSLTLIVEDTLQPFKKLRGKDPSPREMHLHELPWPKDELEALGATDVEMTVTLSYFIEPNPSARGRSRYRYESHGLRFDVKRPTEDVPRFRARVNAAALDDENGVPNQDNDPAWTLGKQKRHRGSLHQDTWNGTAAELASRGYLAVYPSLGWWKTRGALERYDSPARYALIISIKVPEVDTDIYSVIAEKIAPENVILV